LIAIVSAHTRLTPSTVKPLWISARDPSVASRGAIIVIETDHLCMTVRRIQKPGSVTVTSAARGTYAEDQRTRQEAMSLITGQR
jgi:GTP cyclohydrolase I